MTTDLNVKETTEQHKTYNTCSIQDVFNWIPFNFILLDIRSSQEYQAGHIYKSLSMPLTLAKIENSTAVAQIIKKLKNEVFVPARRMISIHSKIKRTVVILGDGKTSKNIYQFLYEQYLLSLNKYGNENENKNEINVSDIECKKNLEFFVCQPLINAFESFASVFPFYCIGTENETKDNTFAAIDDQNCASEIVIHPSCILQNSLYLGTAQQAMNWKICCNLKLTHILNITVDYECVFEDQNLQSLINTCEEQNEDDYDGKQIAFLQQLQVVNPSGIQYLHKHIRDVSNVSISEFLEEGTEFIARALESNNGRCLVHCQMGISRSSSLVIAYLMKYRNMTLCDSYLLTKKCRQLIHPNDGFFRQLIAYEKEIFNGETTEDLVVNTYKLREMSIEKRNANLKIGLGQALLNIGRKKKKNKKIVQK